MFEAFPIYSNETKPGTFHTDSPRAVTEYRVTTQRTLVKGRQTVNQHNRGRASIGAQFLRRAAIQVSSRAAYSSFLEDHAETFTVHDDEKQFSLLPPIQLNERQPSAPQHQSRCWHVASPTPKLKSSHAEPHPSRLNKSID